MSAAPYFDSGGFNRDQQNNIGVVLHDLDGQPYVASGGTGGGGGVVQLQVRDTGLGAWVNLEGTAARGVEVDPIYGSADAAVGLPARVAVIGGYDGANVRAAKTSASGVLQVDVLSGGGTATLGEQQTQTTRLTEIRDRLPDNPISTAPSATDEGLIVHVATMPGGGGGVNTEYTEGNTDASITGIAFLWEDSSDTLRAVSAAKPLPVAAQGTTVIGDGGGSITVDGSVSVSNFPATQPVSGTVTADTELTTADLDSGGGTDTRAVVGLVRAEPGGGLLVGSTNPLPVTVTTSIPFGANAIGSVDVDSILAGDNVIGRVKVTDGTDVAEVVTASGASSPPAAGTAGIVAHIASMPAGGGGGGGTEYTEADTDASITGGVVMWEDTSDTIRATSAAKPLPVNVVAGGTSGTQYTEGDTDASVTGNALMWEDSGDTLVVASATKPLPISDGGGQITVDGTVGIFSENSEDVPASSGDAGIAILGVRNDAAASKTDANGDYSMLALDAAGRVGIADLGGTISVDDGAGSLTVDGTVAVSGGSVTADTELTLADLDTGGGTDNRAVVGLVKAESGGAVLIGSANPLPISGTVTANAGTGPFPVSDNGGSLTVDNATISVVGGGTEATAQRVTIANDSTGVLSVDDNGGSLTVDGTVAISGAVDTELPAAAALADNTANPTVPGVGAFSMVWDGANWDREPATRVVSGTVTANAGTGPFPVSDNGGSLTVDGSVTALGDVAHDAADSGNPQKIGLRAESTDIAAVADGDRTDAIGTLLGKQIVMPYANPGRTVQGSGNKTDTTDLELMAAPGAGIRNYVTHITITNAHATVGTKVVLKSASTIIWRGYADAAGGGVSVPLPTPLRCGANEALNGAAITTGADVDFTAVGFIAAE